MPPREITQITGDLYRANNGNWYTIFFVTPDGIILGDPINAQFAQWLKGELDSRFAGKPVRYVVYSHSHFDHAEGGAAFAATATFVAHENMLRNMDGRYPQMPGDMVDRNDNGVIDRDRDRHPHEHAPRRVRHGPRLLRHLRPQRRRHDDAAGAPSVHRQADACSTPSACGSSSAARSSSSCIRASITPTTRR